VDARLDLGGPIGDDAAGALKGLPGVQAVVPAAGGAVVRVAGRDVVPQVVRSLVEHGLSVFGATAEAPTLEDIYFAVEARIAAAEGRIPAPIAAPAGVEVAS
jgi:hypothetical protein